MRNPKTDIERQVFGETVTVCNEHLGMDSGTDRTGRDDQSSEGSSGPRSHDQNHLVDGTPFLSWPATYALPEGSSSICTNREQRYAQSHRNWGFETWITGGWCYDWRQEVTQVHTLPASTGSDDPAFSGTSWRSPLALVASIPADGFRGTPQMILMKIFGGISIRGIQIKASVLMF